MHVPDFFIDELTTLMEKCLKPNFCKFDDCYYVFPDGVGVPMGSLLGSTLAEIFMNRLEKEFFEAHPQFCDLILYWRRYVDDILILWNGTAALFDQLVTTTTCTPVSKQ